MRLGIWTPLPHTIRAEPAMEEGVRQVKARGDGEADKSFEFALDVVSKGEAYGFDITLIAERLLGPDLEAWMLTAALAARTRTIQIMPAVYPGMITPQLTAKMGSGGIEARTGLRMMPTFPRSPLSFRTAGFPQYGWKAGVSDETFPARQSA